MKITIKNSVLVRPAHETPHRLLWNSNIDLVIPRIHTPSIYFYRHDGSSNFFSFEHLKQALAKTLVPFFPMAGRLKPSQDGRINIDCNNEGVLFVEASTDGLMSSFGDFSPTLKMRHLIPQVDYTKGLSTYPLLILQVTFFKCGGVALGVGVQHHVADGIAALRFMNSWAGVTKGGELDVKPWMDRTLLKARQQPKPKFEHVEYQEAPPLLWQRQQEEKCKEVKTEVFKFSKEQLNELKAAAMQSNNNEGRLTEVVGGGQNCVIKTVHYNKFSTYEILVAHIWRRVSEARGLLDSQATKLYIAVDARTRISPPLPPDYFGNAIFTATPISTAGSLSSLSLASIAAHIHGTLSSMDNSYLRSALDYLELQPDLSLLARGAHTFRSPNLGITSWARLPIYLADFGWGAPLFMGPAGVPFEGLGYVLPSPSSDGSLTLCLALQAQPMRRFRDLVYRF